MTVVGRFLLNCAISVILFVVPVSAAAAVVFSFEFKYVIITSTLLASLLYVSILIARRRVFRRIKIWSNRCSMHNKVLSWHWSANAILFKAIMLVGGAMIVTIAAWSDPVKKATTAYVREKICKEGDIISSATGIISEIVNQEQKGNRLAVRSKEADHALANLTSLRECWYGSPKATLLLAVLHCWRGEKPKSALLYAEALRDGEYSAIGYFMHEHGRCTEIK